MHSGAAVPREARKGLAQWGANPGLLAWLPTAGSLAPIGALMARDEDAGLGVERGVRAAAVLASRGVNTSLQYITTRHEVAQARPSNSSRVRWAHATGQHILQLLVHISRTDDRNDTTRR